MKKIIAFACMLISFSCSLPDDTEKTYVELLPIKNAIVPTEFQRGQIYDIFITFERPSECHAFKDIYVKEDSDGYFFAVMSTVFEANYPCQPLTDVLEKSFTFKPGEQTMYVFKFWHGTNEQGEEDYLTFEIPVVD
ncbi:hypothetical protein ACFSQP_07285 [Bizionia sediminis]|uniref:Lipoprotein n=1 Tax=Bizionia sediminis TaxID=1737064 RepID=A0ABW5KRX4_9FLAO